MKSNWMRILFNAALLGALLWFPWWVAALIALPLVFQFRAYEVLSWGVLGDVLYGVPLPLLAELPILYTVLFSILFLTGEYAKRFLVFYE